MLKFGLWLGIAGVCIYEWNPESLIARSDIHLALPAMLIAGVIFATARFGAPSTFTQVLKFAAGICFAILGSLLIRERAYQWWWRVSVAILLRAIICAGWLLSLAFLIVCITAIRKGTFRWHRYSKQVFKWCLVGFSATMAIELAAFFLLPASSDSVQLPALEQRSSDDPCLIAAIGGSTMTGLPYGPDYGLIQAATAELRHRYPETEFELQNLAVTGVNLAMAIGQLEKLQKSPDVIVVYSGHNEFFHNLEELTVVRATDFGPMDRFLRWSPLFRTINPKLAQYLLATQPADIEPQLFGAPLGNAAALEERLTRYEEHLRALFEWSHQNNIAMVFCVPAAAESGFEPNVSLCESASPEQIAVLEQRWAELRSLQKAGRLKEAMTICRETLDAYPGIAEFEYRLGECLQDKGDMDAARVHFNRALDLDGLPIRTTSAYRTAGQFVANGSGIPIVDSIRVLRTVSSDAILGDDIFLDGVHLNLKGCYVMGQAVADAIASHELLDFESSAANTHRMSFADSLSTCGVDSTVLARAYRTTHDVLERYFYFRPFDTELRQIHADRYLQMSRLLEADEISPGEQGTESLRSYADAGSAKASAVNPSAFKALP